MINNEIRKKVKHIKTIKCKMKRNIKQMYIYNYSIDIITR